MTPVVTLDRAAPLFVDDREYEAAIARRNTTWARWQDACDLLSIARDEIGFDDLRPYIANVNEAQDLYEDAARALIRIRVWRRLGRTA